ncbi:MAG: HEAT repeat domain-containing protein [Opitutae bacterium]|nr:HEAT repeat domain-containing protein [Opitutae bacterium]MBT5692851.1 HEAT repeat domain-containing protein [Opitutae bacterium]MBT6462360.1 HEAT repeat domain-containing protein [Opitutae bacterium]MBT6958162.1 HEAT repeat domain-containing protein [Opitutae bacterium]MBT7853634.1 HEAT repeat domain-containing protein [Opitutae bacterium]
MTKFYCVYIFLFIISCFSLPAQQSGGAVPQGIPEEVRRAIEQARLRELGVSQGNPVTSPSPPVPVITPFRSPGVPGTPSTSPSSLNETLLQAAKDLKSPDENLRVSSAKLLGKYQVSQAGKLLLSVLGDKSIKVRRAAVRSLFENMAFRDRAGAEKLLSMLGDEDVEVRREISKAIPILRSRLSISTTVTRIINGRPVMTSVPYRLSSVMAETVTKALGDEDGIVRQNVLKYYTYLNLPFSAAMLEKCLADPDRGVVDTAMSRIRIVPRTPGIIERLTTIAGSEDPGLRRKLVSSLRGIREPEIQSIQTKLATDIDPYVRIMAAVSLVGLGQPVPAGTIQGVKDFLMRVDSANTQIMSLFYSISDFGEPHAREIYTLLTGHTNSSLRRSAWQRVLNYDNGWNTPSIWTPVLEDTDKRVRENVIGTVQGNLVPVPMDYLEKLIESEFPDVRALAGMLLARHKAEIVSEWMFDLLIDEEAQVRRAILQTAYNIRVDGWQKLLQKSLGDGDPSIQRTAAYGLLGNLGNSEPILRRFVSENPGNPIAIEISRELARRTIIRKSTPRQN